MSRFYDPHHEGFLRAIAPRSGASDDGLGVLIDEFFGFSRPQNFDADMRAALALREEAASLYPPVYFGFAAHPDANEVA
jgi:hypothetical protein